MIALMLGVAAALCATGSQETAVPLKEVSMIAWDRGIIESAYGDITKNWFVTWLNGKVAPMGIKVKVMSIPNTDREVKTATLLAAGSAPDVIMSYNLDTISRYVEQGGVYDYTDLLKTDGKYVPKACSDNDLRAGQIKGRQVTFRRLSNNFAHATFIRKDWLSALGMKEPRTVDELYALLKAIKGKDPGKVGTNLIPLALESGYNRWSSVMMAGFLNRELKPVDMLLEPKTFPEAKETHAFLNKLWNEGLLGNLWLDKGEQQLRQALTRGEVGVVVEMAHYLYMSAYGDTLAKLQEQNPSADYVLAYPWRKTADSKQYYELFKNGPYGFYLYSPTSIKNPKETFRLIDYMYSDEFLLANEFGDKEGVTYSMVNGTPTRLPGYNKAADWVEACYPSGREAWNDNGKKYLDFTAASFTKDAFKLEFVSKGVATTDLPLTAPAVTWPTPSKNKYGPTIDRVFDQKAREAVVAGPADFNALWDAAYKEYMDNGGAAIRDEALQGYAKAYGR